MMRLEIGFCLLKNNDRNIIEVNKLFFQTITAQGWSLSKEYHCDWSKGPSAFFDYIKTENSKTVTLLVEVYTYHSGYVEYVLSMSPIYFDSNNQKLSYYVPKDLYDLVVSEIETIDFFCASMGLEIHGFEPLSSDERYIFGNNHIKYLNDTLYVITYISKECARSCYDIMPAAKSRYDDIRLTKGNLYVEKAIVEEH